MRHLAIGDIHGCYRSLRTLIEFVDVREEDVLITLGDYVDRGPDSDKVLQWLIQYENRGQLVPLRGNHEVMMLMARKDPEQLEHWLKNGAGATLESYSPFENDPGKLVDIYDEHWDFVENGLLPYYEIDTHFFVHANAYAELPLGDQPEFMLYWENLNDPPRHESNRIMVCGHTSQRDGIPYSNGNAICIDTNACRGGWLTCLDVDSEYVYQANEAGETRAYFLDEVQSY